MYQRITISCRALLALAAAAGKNAFLKLFLCCPRVRFIIIYDRSLLLKEYANEKDTDHKEPPMFKSLSYSVFICYLFFLAMIFLFLISIHTLSSILIKR
jgi:hypothetical protein